MTNLNNYFKLYSTEFYVDGAQLGFVVTDADKNLFIYCYEPQDQKSMGGQKLVRAAECNLGQHVNCMFRQERSY